jgi:hypothetical protein
MCELPVSLLVRRMARGSFRKFSAIATGLVLLQTSYGVTPQPLTGLDLFRPRGTFGDRYQVLLPAARSLQTRRDPPRVRSDFHGRAEFGVRRRRPSSQLRALEESNGADRFLMNYRKLSTSFAIVAPLPNGSWPDAAAEEGLRKEVSRPPGAETLNYAMSAVPTGGSGKELVIATDADSQSKGEPGVQIPQSPISNPEAQANDYVLSLYGPHTLYVGYDSYLQLTISYKGKVGHVYFDDLKVPKGITGTVLCSNHPCWRTPQNPRIFQWNADHNPVSVQLHFEAAADAVPKDYSITVTTEVGGVVRSIDVPIQLVTTPAPTPGHPSSMPSIPGLGRWKDEMRRLGAKWCDAKKVYAFGWEGDVWYYDGARVFFQIADYTRDNSWNACALQIAKQYADFVISRNGGVPGWRVFPHGLRMAYERTGMQEYKQAAILLARNSPFASKAGDIRDNYIRETAYVLQAYIEAEKLGEKRNANLVKAADFLIGDFESIFVQHNYRIHQTFYDGLGAAALIEYYELTGDQRVPPTVKLMLDWIWNVGWNHKTHKLIYDPDKNRSYKTELNNLIAPAFAWYYSSINADPIYQRAGDELFGHALDTDISYSGKIFSQNYRWSFDYVKWRSGKTISVSPLPDKK